MNNTKYCVPDPSTRGSATIFTGAYTTLFTCVWTAIHLNVPQSKTSNFTKIVTRIKWLLIGVFIPEIVILRAMKQWVTARDLKNAINMTNGRAVAGLEEIHPESLEDVLARVEIALRDVVQRDEHGLEHRRKHPFKTRNMSLAFFAVAGGIAVDTSGFADAGTICLTSAGMVELASTGVLPDISTEGIAEMSKQDSDAKVLACFQVTWFPIQFFARIVQKLQVTLLELHVATYVFCALTMYVILFHKPYSISRPYICKDESVINLAALFLAGIRVEGAYNALTDWPGTEDQSAAKDYLSADAFE